MTLRTRFIHWIFTAAVLACMLCIVWEDWLRHYSFYRMAFAGSGLVALLSIVYLAKDAKWEKARMAALYEKERALKEAQAAEKQKEWAEGFERDGQAPAVLHAEEAAFAKTVADLIDRFVQNKILLEEENTESVKKYVFREMVSFNPTDGTGRYTTVQPAYGDAGSGHVVKSYLESVYIANALIDKRVIFVYDNGQPLQNSIRY